jgi:hypothetical protein
MTVSMYSDSKCYHLTPDGWVTGQRPANTVESWTRWTFAEHGRRRENVGWTSLWADPRIARSERDALRRLYPALMGSAGSIGAVTTTIGDPI